MNDDKYDKKMILIHVLFALHMVIKMELSGKEWQEKYEKHVSKYEDFCGDIIVEGIKECIEYGYLSMIIHFGENKEAMQHLINVGRNATIQIYNSHNICVQTNDIEIDAFTEGLSRGFNSINKDGIFMYVSTYTNTYKFSGAKGITVMIEPTTREKLSQNWEYYDCACQIFGEYEQPCRCK